MPLATNGCMAPSVPYHLPTGVHRCRCAAPPLAARVAGSLRRGGQLCGIRDYAEFPGSRRHFDCNLWGEVCFPYSDNDA